MPEVNEDNPQWQKDIITGDDAIVKLWLKRGAAGWRLDVADELPNAFLDELRQRVKNATGGQGVVLGEVWENAADKIAYGRRRRYFEGAQLDSVMNYPLRRGLIAFLKEGNAAALTAVLRELWGSYPVSVCHSLMNILTTHDTERILTTLGGAADDGRFTNAELRVMRMTKAERAVAVSRLKMAAALQYTVFGVPSLFYGDEAGMEGYHDPFCRRPYPWGKEDAELLAYYQRLGRIRKENPVLADGDFRILQESESALCYLRENGKGSLMVAANNGDTPFTVTLPGKATELLTDKRVRAGRVTLLRGEVYIWRL